MKPIEICVHWRGLDLIIYVEEWDYYAPDEWMPTSGYVELDFVFVNPDAPVDRLMQMIKDQIDDEPDRFFNRMIEENQDRVYEEGLVIYVERMTMEAEAYFSDERY